MKTCNKCKIEKSLEEFYFRNKSKNIRSYVCKECSVEFGKEYYQSKKTYFSEFGKNRGKELENFLYGLKEKSQCESCGNSDPRVLRFNHPDHKHPSDIKHRSRSKEKLQEEVCKSKVQCANCMAKYFFKELKK